MSAIVQNSCLNRAAHIRATQLSSTFGFKRFSPIDLKRKSNSQKDVSQNPNFGRRRKGDGRFFLWLVAIIGKGFTIHRVVGIFKLGSHFKFERFRGVHELQFFHAFHSCQTEKLQRKTPIQSEPIMWGQSAASVLSTTSRRLKRKHVFLPVIDFRLEDGMAPGKGDRCAGCQHIPDAIIGHAVAGGRRTQGARCRQGFRCDSARPQ
jgi:hypothetical protein